MADCADIANDIMERRMANTIAANRVPAAQASNSVCHECGDEIPAARRKAAPWATTCVECQSILEEKRRHVR